MLERSVTEKKTSKAAEFLSRCVQILFNFGLLTYIYVYRVCICMCFATYYLHKHMYVYILSCFQLSPTVNNFILEFY